MRLTEPQIKAIKHTAHAVLGEGAHVTLKAPNLQPQPIHTMAEQSGIQL